MAPALESAAILHKKHQPCAKIPIEMGWKVEAAKLFAEPFPTFDESCKRLYRSAPHSPHLYGSRIAQFEQLKLHSQQAMPQDNETERFWPRLEQSVTPVNCVQPQQGIPVDHPAGKSASPIEDSEVVLVTENEQAHMREKSMAVRAQEAANIRDIDLLSCRCMLSSTIIKDKKDADIDYFRLCKHETGLEDAPISALAIPNQHHASLATHCDGESNFFADHHREVVLHYRLFGHAKAPQKILFIMGLATQGCAWSYQVEYFRQFKDYQVCIFDNRGVGLSSKPLGRYTTSIMAEDAACLLDHLRWNQYRSIHVVGISMGGMIAQEVSLLVPERILSLALLCTYSGGITLRKLPAISGATKFVSTAFGYWLGERAHTENMMRFLFKDATIQEEGDRLRAYLGQSNRDGGISLLGSMLQYPAVLTHHCSAKQLRTLRFFPFKKLVSTGSDDDIVQPRNSHWLASHLGADLVVIEGTGHGITAEKPDVVNLLLHRHFVEAVQHFRKIHHPLHHLHSE